MTNYLKSQKWDAYIQKQEIYWCITKKYSAVYIVRKEKYKDYENLLFKYTIKNNNLFIKP